MSSSPATFFASVAIGQRVVARYRIAGGFTDALGYLRERDDRCCVIETRRGRVTVRFSDVVAAKPVPEPPARRTPGSPNHRAGSDEPDAAAAARDA